MFDFLSKFKVVKEAEKPAEIEIRCIDFDYLPSKINLAENSSGTTAFIKCPVCSQNLMISLMDITDSSLIVDEHQVQLIAGKVKPQRI